MQMLQANKQPEQTQLRVEDSEDSTEVFLYGVIDEYFGVSAEAFAKTLVGLKGKSVTLRINSPGGDVFDGRAMYAAIKLHGDVTAQIDGLAASAASYVALAAKSVEMIEGGFMMIHNAWTLAFGNKNDFIEIADLLDKFDQSIINDYVKKTGKSSEEIAAMMNEDTWMSAQEALEMGFIDSIFDGDAAADDNKLKDQFDLSAFDNVPAALVKEAPDQNQLWIQQRATAERRLRLLNAAQH